MRTPLRITEAAEGTLFLDGIGDLSAASQVKLLRLLQDGSYYPLGADRRRQNRAPVIAATNQHVVQRVDEGCFARTSTTGCAPSPPAAPAAQAPEGPAE